MAEIDTKPNFGIENTVDTSGAGNQQLLDNLFETESVSADADDVSAIDNTDDGKGPDGKADPTQLAGGEDDVPETAANNPDSLTNFLLGGEEEEEEEEKEDDDPIAADENETTEGDEPPAGIPEPTASDEGEEGEEGNEIAFDSLANELADLGVFTREEGEEEGIKIESPEDFLERFKKEKELGAQAMISEFIGQFGSEHQKAFQAIYVDGANPRDYFSQVAQIEDFSSLDLTKEENQERVVRQALTDQLWEAEDIDKELEKLRNYGDLEDVSKRHHKVLIKKEQQSLAQKAEQAKIANQQKQTQKSKYIENVQSVLQDKIKAKEFDGIPVNVNTANELQDFLLVDKWKTESGETLTDFDKSILDLKRPENHEQKVKVALLLKLLEKDPTLSTIQKRGVSQKSSQLFKDVARQKTTAKRAVANNKQPAKSWFQK